MGNLFSTNNNNVKLMIEYKQQLEELKKQNRALIKLNEELRDEIKNLMNPQTPKSTQLPINYGMSMDLVKKHVREMLEREECNIEYIPDFVERRLYEKIFGMILALMEHTLETSSINFMGHDIRFYITRVNEVNTEVNDEK